MNRFVFSSNFFDASGGGEPVAYPDLAWLLGEPSFWLSVAIWMVLLAGLMTLGKRLWTANRLRLLTVYSSIASAAVAYYVWLAIGAFSLFTRGAGDEVAQYRYANMVVVALSVVSLFWLVLGQIRKAR